MKILCVIDHFGSGGAQRQMVELACGLNGKSHQVEMFVYYPQYDFFRAKVTASSIPIHEVLGTGGFSWAVLRSLMALLTSNKFDVVVSFLKTPSIYAELACLATPNVKLVVSERTSRHDDVSRIGALFRRVLHRASDCVVANSHDHAGWLRTHFNWLNGKVTCIYNGVDVGAFTGKRPVPRAARDLKLLAIGRVGPEKNAVNLIKACELFFRSRGWVPSITWIGRRDSSRRGQQYCHEVDELLRRWPEIARHWCWLKERSDIPAMLEAHDALIHPSFYEGLPNVVCEALAAARPVLASAVGDNTLLVPDGLRGFIFDPKDPASIMNAMDRLANLDQHAWCQMSSNARAYAERNLKVESMVASYDALFRRLCS